MDHPNLKKHDIVVTYTNTTKPRISSMRSPREVALKIWREWGDYGETGRITKIKVDGESFTVEELSE